jgi:ketosteroid isomerase-like protein
MLQRRHPVLQSGRCKSMAIRFLLFGVILLLTQEMLPAAQDDAPSATDDLATVFSSIERAWSEGDADAIVARFGERKVLLRLPDNPHASRRFSHQQSRLILKDHFLTNEIRGFSFVRTQVPETAQARAIGLASVTWRRHGAGRTREGRVLMVLEREGDRWVLIEVLALP